MKKEIYLIKAKHIKAIRTAIYIMLCVIFIPLIVFTGVIIAKGELNQSEVPGIIDATAGIVQTKPSASTATKSNEDTFTGTDESKTDIEEDLSKEEPATITSGEETQGTMAGNSSTEPCTEPQTESATTAARPSTTKQPATKPVATQPPTTIPTTTQPYTTKPSVTSNIPSIHLVSDEQVMLNLINQERRNNGVPELKLDTKVGNVAQIKCREMIELNYFGHQSPVYGSPFEMMKFFGITFVKAGENLAMNTSIERAHIALMNSEEHRKTMLNPDYTYVGIGAYQGVSGKYYTQMYICS